MSEVDDELLVEFLAESREQLATAETDLLAIEAAGAALEEERMNRVFRGIHTIKGGAPFFELGKIGELAHHAENVLALIRSRHLAPTTDRIAVLLRAVDRLTEMVQSPATSNAASIDDLVEELKSFSGDGGYRGQETAAGQTAPPRQNSGALRVLLAEDDRTNRLLLQGFLSGYGECHVAVNGKEAVEAARRTLESGRAYDLICLDILMPEMTGREALRQIRKLEEEKGIASSKGAKIVMTTSVKEMREVFRCYADLCDSYLQKPIDLSQLLTLMKSFQLVA